MYYLSPVPQLQNIIWSYKVITVAQLWEGEGHPFYVHIQMKNAGLLVEGNGNDMASKVKTYIKKIKNKYHFLFSLLEMDVNTFTPLLVAHG